MATLAAGFALRDCVVIAAAGPLALRAFYIGMDANAPMAAIRAAIRSALAGVASLLAASVLVLMALGAIHGIWQPTHDRLFAGVWLLAAAIAALALSSREEGLAVLSGSQWLIGCMALAAGIATAFLARDFAWSLCALPLATALLMALAGWRLLHEVASELLRLGLEK